MNLFNRLPGFPRTPAGKERVVLRQLPKAFLFGTLLLAVPSLLARLIASPDEALAVTTTDIYVISLVILHWTVVFTVGIAACIVMMMKGPAYVADAYPLDEAEAVDEPPKWKPHGNHMADEPVTKSSAVPHGRWSRLARLGSLAGGVAGNMLAEGARQFAQGKRPQMHQLLLTPANARRVADQLAQLRGAAMKVGQLLSMDAGELLPPELAEILSRLRADAIPMPMSQVVAALNANWGEGWDRYFERFSFTPMAAASIGQVHFGQRKDGRKSRSKSSTPASAAASTVMSTTLPPCSAFPACCRSRWTSSRCSTRRKSNCTTRPTTAAKAPA